MPVRGGERGEGSLEYWDPKARRWTSRGVKTTDVSFTREGETIQVIDEEGNFVTDDPRITYGEIELDVLPITLRFEGSKKT